MSSEFVKCGEKNMSATILEMASCEACWQEFLEYKLSRQHLDAREEREIRDFMERKAYLPLCDAWRRGEFPAGYPVKRVVNKQGSEKKRIVYSFPGDEGILLKFIAFQLFQYDGYFYNNCYAFRRKFGVKDAIRRIRSMPGLQEHYCLKVDISNYFNSIDVDRLLDRLSFVQKEDETLYDLFERLLGRQQVMENGMLVSENHGAMAGIPLSPFFANVYLREVDAYFVQQGVPYFRYSDDILIFARTAEELLQRQEQLYRMIGALSLAVNPDKVHVSAPGEVWEFLGFCYRGGEIDLSDMTLKKIKARIKRKADALRRWQRKKGLAGEKAAIGLIRAMNYKFYGSDGNSKALTGEWEDTDFTWSRWFFPNLTVDDGLRKIDNYFQEYIRYTVTGRHYKGNYRIRYEQLKEWGYRSLVHEFYRSKKE